MTDPVPANAAATDDPEGYGSGLSLRGLPGALGGVLGATMLCFVAIGCVLPVLPLYVRGPLGAGDLAVGVVVGSSAAFALLGRPVAGRRSDARGPKGVFVVGAALVAVAGAGYYLPFGVEGLVAARLLLGLGEGLAQGAGAAWALVLVPPERHGQAIALFGLAPWTGAIALGPFLGEVALRTVGYGAVWALAAALPLLALALAARTPDPAAEPGETTGDPAPLFPREAIGPGIALTLVVTGFGALSTFAILHLNARGIRVGGTVLVVFGVTLIVTRLLAGGTPDRFGARRCGALAAIAEALGLVGIALATSAWQALAAAAVMGVSFALIYPSLALLVLERAKAEHRGSAIGTFTSFFDVGIGLSGPIIGAVAARSGYQSAFLAVAAVALATAVLIGRPGAGRSLRQS